MFSDISIDRESEIPVYRQIIEQVTSLVTSGGLKPGDKLPPERELAIQLGIARGTITKAYEELVRSGVIEVTQGRGSYD
jgi:DNA-binding transcriptional regulator YhcF (GntR family)